MADEPFQLDVNAVITELNKDPLSKALLERAQLTVLVGVLQDRLAQRDQELAQLKAASPA